MNTLTLWLLLSLPADPAATVVLGTHRSRDACEAAQVSAFISGQHARCQALVIPAGVVMGPVQ